MWWECVALRAVSRGVPSSLYPFFDSACPQGSVQALSVCSLSLGLQAAFFVAPRAQCVALRLWMRAERELHTLFVSCML